MTEPNVQPSGPTDVMLFKLMEMQNDQTKILAEIKSDLKNHLAWSEKAKEERDIQVGKIEKTLFEHEQIVDRARLLKWPVIIFSGGALTAAGETVWSWGKKALHLIASRGGQ